MQSGLMMLRAGKQKGLAGLNETSVKEKKSQTSRLIVESTYNLSCIPLISSDYDLKKASKVWKNCSF